MAICQRAVDAGAAATLNAAMAVNLWLFVGLLAALGELKLGCLSE
jgi:hypothetical protein